MRKLLFVVLLILVLPMACIFAETTDSPNAEDEVFNNAQTIFNGFFVKDYSVAKYIWWEEFRINEDDIGEEYSKLTNETAQNEYKKQLLDSIINMFTSYYDSADDFGDWGIDLNSDNEYVVSTDSYYDQIEMHFCQVNGKWLLHNIDIYSYDDY